MSIRRDLGVLCTVVLVGIASAAPAGAATEPKRLKPPFAGAQYSGKGTELEIDSVGKAVRIFALPITTKCKTATPTNLGDFGSSGLGPFTLAADGSFSNIRGSAALPSQTVINGRFQGAKVTGTIKDPAFVDEVKGFDCPEFNGKFTATYVKGSGDAVAPGATLVSDDFSDPKSGFATFNIAEGYAEYLKDSRFRIGAWAPSASRVPLVSLRTEPKRADADVTVTTLTFAGGTNDVMGVACQATGATSFVTGLVSMHEGGFATVIRYSNGVPTVLGQAALPPGLLKTGSGAQNMVRLVCKPSTTVTSRFDLSLNGTQLVSASGPSAEGQTGLAVGSGSGSTEINFKDFEVVKPTGT